MASELELTGGCLCGAVRYRCAAPLYTAVVCHCTSCRRSAPTDHIWMEDAVGWDRPGDGLPCHSRLRV